MILVYVLLMPFYQNKKSLETRLNRIKKRNRVNPMIVSIPFDSPLFHRHTFMKFRYAARPVRLASSDNKDAASSSKITMTSA